MISTSYLSLYQQKVDLSATTQLKLFTCQRSSMTGCFQLLFGCLRAESVQQESLQDLFSVPSTILQIEIQYETVKGRLCLSFVSYICCSSGACSS